MTRAAIAETALLLCDLQNDFLSEGGAYHRGGVTSLGIAALPARLAPLVRAMRAAGGWVVSTHFPLVPGRNGLPFISPHLQRARPFLRTGDFQSGSWGHALVDNLAPADLAVEKVAFSAFYQTRLEWVLARAGITRLLVAGIVTNGGVASTVRDAHVRDLAVTLLTDGCAAFDAATHATAVEALRSVAATMTIRQQLDLLSGNASPDHAASTGPDAGKGHLNGN